jgi:hypothetical protein
VNVPLSCSACGWLYYYGKRFGGTIDTDCPTDRRCRQCGGLVRPEVLNALQQAHGWEIAHPLPEVVEE